MDNRKLQIKNLSEADEVRNLPKTKIEVANFNDTTIMRLTLQPGWKWSECVKPTVGTASCEAIHFNYIISGHLMIAMDNGVEKEVGPGDAAAVPSGHDAWVIGEEPCVAIDFSAGQIYGLNLTTT
jgi:hypothetical protein